MPVNGVIALCYYGESPLDRPFDADILHERSVHGTAEVARAPVLRGDILDECPAPAGVAVPQRRVPGADG